MTYVYAGYSLNHLGQPILPLSPYGSPYGGNVPGDSPQSPNVYFPQTLEYTPWQRSTALPHEYTIDDPPAWVRLADSRYGDPYSFSTFVGGYYNHHQRSDTRNPNTLYEYSPTSYYGPPSLALFESAPPVTNHVAQKRTYRVHPLLDGLIQNSTLTFNLASPNYCPAIFIGSGYWSRIPNYELRQPATWPPVYRLRIFCELIPQWPIDIELDPSYYSGGYPIPPVQVGDVLWSIWNNMRTAIAQSDWSSLPADKQEAVSKTFHRRYSHYGNPEREKGVLRIDYTLGKVWFKGLTKVGEGLDVFEMHVV